MAFYRLGDLDSAIRNAEAALRQAEVLVGGEEDDSRGLLRGTLGL